MKTATVGEKIRYFGMVLDISNYVEVFVSCVSVILFKDLLKLRWSNVHRAVNKKRTLKKLKTKSPKSQIFCTGPVGGHAATKILLCV